MKLPKFLRRNLFKTKKKNTQLNNNEEVRGITLKAYRKKDTIIANLQNEKATLVETNTTLVIKIKNLEQEINDLKTKLSTMGYRTNEALYNKLPPKIEPLYNTLSPKIEPLYASMTLRQNPNQLSKNKPPAEALLYEDPKDIRPVPPPRPAGPKPANLLTKTNKSSATETRLYNGHVSVSKLKKLFEQTKNSKNNRPSHPR